MSAIHEPFSEGASPAHHLDPPGKIAIAGLYACLMAVATCYVTAFAGLALAFIWLAMARLPLKIVIARLLVVNGFIFFLWLVLPLTYPGDAVLRIGPLVVTRQGLIFTGLITLKSNAIVIALIAMIATAPIITLGQAMHVMRFPDKLCHLLLFTYRGTCTFWNRSATGWCRL